MATNDGSKPKRRFKNPESFREKALKAADQQNKPKKENSKLRGFFGSIFSPLSANYRKAKDIKALSPLFVVLRLIGRLIFPKYFRTSLDEIKKVTWPSFKQSRRLTYAVLIFAFVFGASVALVDWGLGKIFKHILLK